MLIKEQLLKFCPVPKYYLKMASFLFIPIISFIIFFAVSPIDQIRGRKTKYISFIRPKSFQIGLFSLIGLFLYSISFESDPMSYLYIVPIIFFLISVFFYFRAKKAGAGAPDAAIFIILSFIIGLISLIGLFIFL